MEKKGFTLIELLIVIGIIAILAAVTLVVLNPAEMLRKARDSQRLQDLDSLGSAISLYLAEIESPTLDGGGGNCRNVTGGTTNSDVWCSYTTSAVTPCTVTVATGNRNVDGTGWVPINFTQLSVGAPFGSLPVDPTNDQTKGFYYRYACDDEDMTFELNANLESKYYTTTKNYEGNDGGSNPNLYEKGSEPGLDLIS